MYEFIKLDKTERSQAFRIASEKLGYPAYVIEKDLWVTYMLDILFNKCEHNHSIMFKGGTSLSKCYGLIDRFSEDIDLSLKMEDLGFGGDKAPHIIAKDSKAASKRAIKELKFAGEQFLENTLLVLLKEILNNGLASSDNWDLILDENNKENILFYYPRALEDDEYSENDYVKPVVLIETGTKSEHIPIEEIEINSLLEDAISSIKSNATLKVLSPKRTFWEKVTILHAENNINKVERVRERLSRHLYDIVMIKRSKIGREAIQDINLLEIVAKHKEFYYRSAAAKYNEAKPSTLNIVPKGDILEAFKVDYLKMKSMFANEVIEFDELIAELTSLEEQINL